MRFGIVSGEYNQFAIVRYGIASLDSLNFLVFSINSKALYEMGMKRIDQSIVVRKRNVRAENDKAPPFQEECR